MESQTPIKSMIVLKIQSRAYSKLNLSNTPLNLEHSASSGSSRGVATLKARKGAFDALKKGSGAFEKVK